MNSAAAEKSDPVERPKLLYVDDEDINRLNFEMTFNDEYEIITAASGEEALKIFKQEKNISMVVADQRMPGMQGVELLSEIYHLDPEPVRIILTAYKAAEDLIDAINKGHVYQYILKPWDEKELRLTLTRIREVYRLTTENRELFDELVDKNKILEKVNAEKQRANERLRRDLKKRKELEEELQIRTIELEEANFALKSLLRQSSEAREDLEAKIIANIKELVMPHVNSLEKHVSDRKARLYLNVIRDNLDQIASSFSRRLASTTTGLTPREIQIADLVRQGRTNKDIAELLSLSRRTVETYRDSLRRKFKLKNKKVNLRTHLMSMSDSTFPHEA